MEVKLKNIFLGCSIAFDVIFFDQFSKYWVLNSLPKKLILIPDIISFELHYNSGIAFSIPINGLLLPVSILILLSFLVHKYSKTLLHNNKLTFIVIGLIFGGSISNLIDRIIHSAVVDFISIGNFPVFNLADTAISIAAILMIIFQKKIFQK